MRLSANVATWLLALACLALPARAADLAIINGSVHSLTGAPVTDGATVLIRNGRIAAVGRNVSVPEGAQVIDAAGRPVTPGVFPAFSRLGLAEVNAVSQTNDIRAKGSAAQVALQAADGFNPAASVVAVSRIEGVTRAIIAPDATASIFAGQGAAVALGGGPNGGGMVTDRALFQLVELGEEGAEIAGGSRPAALEYIRNALREAQDYQRNGATYRTGGTREALTNISDTRALIPVLDGTLPMLVHVNRASDILAVLALRTSFPGLKIILLGAAEGWQVASQIAAARVPVVLYAWDNLPGRFEMLAASQSNAGVLRRAGVDVALGMLDNSEMQARLMPQQAGNLVAQGRVAGGLGLSHAEALEAIMLAPARIFGLADQYGSLAPGKVADAIVWDGDPLEVMSAPTAVVIAGEVMPLTSRQTQLRDRYLDLDESQLPVQYRK